MRIEEMIAARRADCSGCEACANICPQNAIEMTRDAEGFAYPKINPALCIKCGRCDATCPALNFKEKIPVALPKIFAAVYDDDKIRRHSSSGGIFSALSEIILQNGGVVFGAAFDKNWRVIHTAAQNFDELENLRGSKYVQSQIGDVYRQAKNFLKAGRSVLFSGTPCQCAGLKHFLGEDPDNLLTVELICHGVPSPALWENYIGELGYAHEVKHVNFRSKRYGWGSNLEINFSDQGHYFFPNDRNPYGKLFLRSLSERPSCSSCKFRFPNGRADLTIGDAWGIEHFAPEMFDRRGVSLVFVHTDKGKDFFEQANLKTRRVKFLDAVKRNYAVMIPFTADLRRGNFFAELSNVPDKLAVMEKYFYQDDSELRGEVDKRNYFAFQKCYQELAAQVRQKFERNILVLSSTRDKDEQNALGDFFEQHFPNCGVYLLQSGEEEPLTCTEYFSSFTAELKDNAATLSDFARRFNVTEIYVENPLRVYIERPLNFNLSAVLDWLKSCGLPVRTFSRETE